MFVNIPHFSAKQDNVVWRLVVRMALFSALSQGRFLGIPSFFLGSSSLPQRKCDNLPPSNNHGKVTGVGQSQTMAQISSKIQDSRLGVALKALGKRKSYFEVFFVEIPNPS